VDGHRQAPVTVVRFGEWLGAVGRWLYSPPPAQAPTGRASHAYFGAMGPGAGFSVSPNS